ncbi:GSCOCG00012555001-RA-CDS [Cotesia congregata]|nr:GSCOCG00012555001-RA-CDS [Cotesia congregata]
MFQFGAKTHQNSDPIFHNGYCYIRSFSSNSVVYVKCHEMSKSNCRARGTTDGGPPITLSTNHNHPPNFDTELIYNFQKNLYTAVISNLRDLRLIYDDISLGHSRASILLPFVEVVRTMRTWRTLNCPPVPKTFQEYVLRLNSQRWKNLFFKNDSSLTAAHVVATDRSEAVVFLDSTLLLNFQTVHLFADATYKVCPRNPKKIFQLFTIMASIDDTVVPVLWSLMSRKTKCCYAPVIDHFKRCGPHLQVLSITTDYEMGLKKVCQRFYPNARSKGCYFHFMQALIKKSKDLGLWNKLLEWEDGREFFRKLIGLAFLPANEIHNALNYLKMVYQVFLPSFQSFLQYFESYWMNYVKPENWSIFSFLDRTNNSVESNNRRINVKFGIHTRIWQFTGARFEDGSANSSFPAIRGKTPKCRYKSGLGIIQ